MNNDFMLAAIIEAKKALKHNEVPVGAVIVYKNNIIAKAYNKKEKCNLVTKHAELIAIEKASKKLNNWRLNDCDIYITLEPCPMCASAIKQSRISNVYYCAKSNNVTNNEIVDKIFNDNYSNSKINYCCGYFNDEVEQLLSNFFSKKRHN